MKITSHVSRLTSHVSRLTSHVSRLLVVFFLSSSVAVFAQTNNWTLATGGNWNDTANWSLGSVPNATDTAIGIDLNNNQTINLQGGTYTIGSLTSKGTPTNNTTTISNGTLKLETSSGTPELIITKGTSITAILDVVDSEFTKSGTGALSIGVTNAETYYKINATQGITQLLLTRYDLSKSTGKIISDINISSGATFRGFDLTIASSVTWTGKLTGSGTFQLINGSGVHTLDMDASGFSGTVSASGGTVQVLIARDDALGVGSTYEGTNKPILTNGTITRTLHSSLAHSSIASGDVIVFGDSVNQPTKTGGLIFTGGLHNNRGTTSSNTGILVDGITVEIQGKVTGGFATALDWTKSGSGMLVLSGANSDYQRHTIVSEGTLLVNGSIANPTSGAGTRTFTVAANATLGGTGTINGRPLTVNANAILAPGDSTKVDTTGTLTVNSAVTFAEGAIFRLELNSDTAYDKIVMGSIYGLTFNGLGATLDLHLNNQFDFLENMEFIIAEGFGNLSGKFAGINEDDIFTSDGVAFKMNYLSNSIKLTVVPEPSILALMGLALTGALVFRRRGQ